jgi:chaperonin cofactor prefoldin
MKIILIITIFALLVFSIWNLITLRELKSKRNSEERRLDDSKYFELKFKMEFLITVFSVIVALIGLLGYNTLQNAKSEIKSELNKEFSPIEIRMKNTEKSINDKDSIVKTLESKTFTIANNLGTFDYKAKKQDYSLTSLENKIADINGKNIIKQNYYIVNSIKYKYHEADTTLKKFYFAVLKTNLGDKLPMFETPPLIIPIPESNAMTTIFDITRESFKVGFSSYYGTLDTIQFSVLIIKK